MRSRDDSLTGGAGRMMDATAIRRKRFAAPTRFAEINPLPYTTNLVMGCDIFAVALER